MVAALPRWVFAFNPGHTLVISFTAVEYAGMLGCMSYQTLEVELENGQVRPSGAESLPPKAHALLTILRPAAAEPTKPARSLGEALRELQVEGKGLFADLSTNKRHLDDLGK